MTASIAYHDISIAWHVGNNQHGVAKMASSAISNEINVMAIKRNRNDGNSKTSAASISIRKESNEKKISKAKSGNQAIKSIRRRRRRAIKSVISISSKHQYQGGENLNKASAYRRNENISVAKKAENQRHQKRNQSINISSSSSA